MRFTAILLLTLAAAPSVHSWMCGPTVLHSSLGDFDQDELFGPAIRLRAVPRQANPREAEKTFRQLDRFVDRVAGAFLDEDMAAREGKECLVKSKNCTASPIPSSKGLEIRLRPSFEWKETETGFVFTAATPGLPKEDLVVEIVEATSRGGHYLVVSGESRAEAEGKQAQSFRAFYKRFEQKVKLPEGVDRNTLTARYENGLLQVHFLFPKPEEEKFERKKIAIQ